MRLVAATNNAHKLKEIRAILSGKFDEVLSLADLGLTVDAEETGETFFDNALIKARAVCEAAHLPALSDDTGLCVNALGGDPGVRSARYAGEHGDDAANNRKLLLNLQGVEGRSAYFETSVVLYYPDGSYVSGAGKACGRILKAPKGCGGFGYDALFLSDELGLTFGEASEEQKNAVSHRARALADLLKKL